jgi:hypothetical protein
VGVSSLKRESILGALLLLSICIILVAWRIYYLFIVADGYIFGDVSNHYFPAGQSVLSGENPYDNHFINHPPYMILLFALLVWMYPATYTIGLFILGLYLLVPILSYHASISFLDERRAVIAAWIITLNPMTLYSGLFMLDDDLLIMMMILMIMILYERHPKLAIALAGVFGGFKFVPLVIGLFLVFNDSRQSYQHKVQHTILGLIPFLSSLAVGIYFWGFETLYRITNYVSTVRVGYPSMSFFYLLTKFFDIPDANVFRDLALILTAILVIGLSALRWKCNIAIRSFLPHLILVALVAVYLGNATTNYTYFAWIIPSLSIVSLLYDGKERRLVIPFLIFLTLGFGYFTSEWANFTWAYESSLIFLADLGTIFVWTVLALYVVIVVQEFLRNKGAVLEIDSSDEVLLPIER